MASEATLKFLLVGEDRSAGKALRNAGRDAESTGDKFKRLGKVAGTALAGGLVTAGAAVVKFGQQASDLGETQSKVAQIFGEESSAALDKFAETAGKNLGQSKQQALDAAATFGIIGKSAGKSGTDLVKFSTQMTGLAGDLASFNNSTPEEAIEAIGSAMRGEAEPIRKYGVLLDDATLRAEALELGLIKSVKEGLTPQQKALAAQAAILKQTKDAQGDFARTSDGLANKQRILKAEFNNLTTEVGQKALPVMLDVTNAALGLVEGFEEGTGAGGEIRDVLEDIGDAGKAVFKFFEAIPGPVKKYGAEIAVAAVVTSKLRGLIGPLGQGLTGLATRFRDAETRTASLKSGLRGLGSGLTTVAGAGGMVLLADSTNEASEGLGVLKGAAGGALSGAALGAFAGPLGAAIGGGIGAVAGGIFSLATNTKKSGEAAEAATPPLERYMSAIEGGANAIARFNTEQAIKNLGKDALAAGRALGILPETLARAAQGSPKAIDDINVALKRARGQIEPTKFTVNAFGQVVQELDLKSGALRKSVNDVTTALGLNQAAYRKDVTEANNAALAVGDYSKVLPGLDRKVQTKIALLGLSDARNNIVDLTRKYDLARKDVRTILEAAGYEPTKDKITDILNKANALDGTTATVTIGAKLAGQAQAFGQMLFGSPEKRAMGGPVTAGQPYIVGDGGRPELFVPNQSGTILPRVPTGGGSDIDYARMTEAFIAALMRVPITRLPDAGRGSYMAGASFQ